ncbi:UDP-N-acetylglucosamine--N-acetylmuramyl-(pentapeptide) pyrophosphoryl-undecaprenol N-acetylglucosamine transferase [Chitinivorax tropicus]|uniref:UDP-N-acetylglucosamine--N-acetylmuramyl-(pentapeptide) pyrophosphoryl-undecaprenol N-acetylglucosamine transferase n=1 Tax=Chitinivorax tropicus TaxID=714531 RepID=A0A840MRJ4_9PROT|nr:undecaprenyldiphospho-muramoylpentapeptide beta-N-acetylglucosaminyltransferase [Chitinivorax tropicus]MBB5018853.1 UDP-N-acetylglucosamine--N-acetylmuramyl-(pentapeptide) pyrophosphoryl-undecaprenol N-acetylglucosamine transferase [Chitinivorax tropicus]
MSGRTILIMAGGTGGHVFPALALADAMKAHGWKVVWLGGAEGMETKLVPQHGYPIETLRIAGLRGKGLVRKLVMPLMLLRAFAQSIGVIRKHRPAVVAGFGGYPAFPGGMMAALLGKPLLVHEQNSVAGLTNKVLSGVADAVLTAFPAAFKSSGKVQLVGNPVRETIARLPAPAERFAGRQGPLKLLVVGGSLGAQALNEHVPAALALMPEGERPKVTHQAGAKHIEALRAAYAKAGVQANTVPFIDDMATAYAEADLVICRSGALTVAELAVAGVASVLVPFPHAVDDHQTGNARYLADNGAAVLMPQTELNPQSLAALLQTMSRDKLGAMADAARRLAKPDATEAVAAVCMSLAGEKA